MHEIQDSRSFGFLKGVHVLCRIFDFDGLLPIWGPHFETSNEFLGTFPAKDNLAYRVGIDDVEGIAKNYLELVVIHTNS